MRRPKWLNGDVTFLVCLVLCLEIVVLVGAGISSMPAGYDAKKARAHLGCKALAQATEAYFQNTSSSETKLDTLSDLLHPQFGGSSFLRNGQSDLIDPWGKPYEMERLKKSNGDPFILIKTTAPDGILITQFGIGKIAQP
jgi:hypothetical protein